MAIGTDLVDGMHYLDNDIDQIADQDQAVWALNRAQDVIELAIASISEILGTFTNVTTAADVETTATPTRFKRYDRMQFIDPTNSRPSYNLQPGRNVGDVLNATNFASGYWGGGGSGSSGQPRAYAIYGSTIHWAPLPDATHTVRVYGFQALADITASGTFGYGDEFIAAICAVAVRSFKQQVDDPQEDINSFAAGQLGPILDQLAKRWKDGPGQARDMYIHTV